MEWNNQGADGLVGEDSSWTAVISAAPSKCPGWEVPTVLRMVCGARPESPASVSLLAPYKGQGLLPVTPWSHQP